MSRGWKLASECIDSVLNEPLDQYMFSIIHSILPFTEKKIWHLNILENNIQFNVSSKL